jgi:hypothetical protein
MAIAGLASILLWWWWWQCVKFLGGFGLGWI